MARHTGMTGIEASRLYTALEDVVSERLEHGVPVRFPGIDDDVSTASGTSVARLSSSVTEAVRFVVLAGPCARRAGVPVEQGRAAIEHVVKLLEQAGRGTGAYYVPVCG